MTDKHNNDAVSPVVGVMLMLVVTIIVAAIVSSFAGGITSTQSKTPQAKISATFSIADGMTITHEGGDAIPLDNLIFTTQSGANFGPDTGPLTTQQLNPDIITDMDGNQVFSTDMIGGKSSFNPGDTLYISAYNCTAPILQPLVAAPLLQFNRWDWKKNPTTFPAKNKYISIWYLCYRNPGNIGKIFTFQAGDRSGNIISTCEVKITA